MKTKKISASPRFVKLSTTGRELSAKAKKWTQVLDRETGLIWLADASPCGRVDWKAAKGAAATTKIGKHKDWRMPTIKELLSLVDYSRTDPAIDTTFFRCEPSFHWTSTPLASSPGDYAWLVYFYYGYADYYLQSYAAFVRPVRSARASQ